MTRTAVKGKNMPKTLMEILDMTDKPTRGGIRTPAGGRPRKDNVVLHCYVPPFILEEIDQYRGVLSRGEYITMLLANEAINRSNQI